MSEFSLILVLQKENKQNSNMTWQKYKLTGTLQGLVQKEMLIDLLATLPEEANADTKENDPHEGGRQSLVFAMAILMVSVFRLRRETHEEQHDDVCHEVGEGVHGIGHHGTTVPPYTSDELEDQQ